jgi:LPS sulfotransferase NodH
VTTKFVLLSTQRSGSTWVVDMLNSHVQVTAYSELLLEKGQGKPTWGGAKDLPFWSTYLSERRHGRAGPSTKAIFFEYLDEVFAPRDGVRAAGFKLMYGQAGAHDHLGGYLVSRRVRVVHLIRRNLLDIIVSKEVAAARDVYHARVGDEVPPVRVRVDASTLLDRLRWQEREAERARKRITKLELEYMEIGYEELRTDHARFDGLLEFLGVEPCAARLSSSLRPVNDARHEEVVEDYAQVKQALKGSRFANLLQ